MVTIIGLFLYLIIVPARRVPPVAGHAEKPARHHRDFVVVAVVPFEVAVDRQIALRLPNPGFHFLPGVDVEAGDGGNNYPLLVIVDQIEEVRVPVSDYRLNPGLRPIDL